MLDLALEGVQLPVDALEQVVRASMRARFSAVATSRRLVRRGQRPNRVVLGARWARTEVTRDLEFSALTDWLADGASAAAGSAEAELAADWSRAVSAAR